MISPSESSGVADVRARAKSAEFPGRWACRAPGRRACCGPLSKCSSGSLRSEAGEAGRTPGDPVLQGPWQGRLDYWHWCDGPRGHCGAVVTCRPTGHCGAVVVAVLDRSAGGPNAAGTGLGSWCRVAKTGRLLGGELEDCSGANRPSRRHPSARWAGREPGLAAGAEWPGLDGRLGERRI